MPSFLLESHPSRREPATACPDRAEPAPDRVIGERDSADSSRADAESASEMDTEHESTLDPGADTGAANRADAATGELDESS